MLRKPSTIYFFICITLISSWFPLEAQTSTNESSIELQIDSLLQKMSLVEKIGQTAQRGKSSRDKELPAALKDQVRQGKIGSFLNIMNKEDAKELQRIAIEESPNGIPLIFARDVIHGFKTIFPIPLGQAATFDPEIAKEGARISAIEASSYGIRWTFAPMLDISRDPRWGRIAESAGEDAYLTSKMAEGYVKGFQGADLSDPTSMAACAKHFAGYGAAEGGRDYNSTNINPYLLQNVYLKPFKAAVDAGCATFMTGFNDLNGIPASANSFILKDILREQWGFDGFVVSDWNSVVELVNHGYAENSKHAAQKAANAGVDMEMNSTTYQNHLKSLLEQGKFSETQLNEMVRNILRVKFRLGLFEQPYFNPDEGKLYAKEHLAAAKRAAIQSAVLLKNQNEILPLSKSIKVAVIGPLADAPLDQLGTWIYDGEKEKTQTPLNAFTKDSDVNYAYLPGLTYSRDKDTIQFKNVIKNAEKSDVILFFGGEEAILSGEAHSRANLELPGAQEALIHELHKTGKPIVLILMAGRPITLTNIINKVDAVYMLWHPGTMGGPAIKDLLFGEANPSGKLPVTWPKVAGQIPIYYNFKNTGRPVVPEEFVQMDSIPIGAWQSSLGNTSHYLDVGFLPDFPFGYGLSYTQFSYNNIKISPKALKIGDQIKVTATVKNTGTRIGTETVQLYFQDKVGSITRPVKELVRFQKVTLSPGASKEVTFTFHTDDLQFYGPEDRWVTEPGEFKLWVAKHSQDEAHAINFTLQK